MSEYRYGPEVAEMLAAKNALEKQNLPMEDRYIRVPEHMTSNEIFMGQLIFTATDIVGLLKKHPEYRNHAPMKELQALTGFSVQQWIDEGKL